MAKRKAPAKRTPKKARKRTKEEITSDRILTWELYNQKVSQEKIAATINERANGKYKITRQTISADIEYFRKELIEQLPNKDRHMMDQIGRIDRLESAAWDAWERSKVPIKKHTKIKKEGKTPLRISKANKSNKITTSVEVVDIDYTEDRKTVEEFVGDPKFMDQIRWCIMERSKLLALYSTTIKTKDGEVSGEIQSSGSGTVVYLPDNGRKDYDGKISKDVK